MQEDFRIFLPNILPLILGGLESAEGIMQRVSEEESGKELTLSFSTLCTFSRSHSLFRLIWMCYYLQNIITY
jgi:hypothetical protein